MVITMVAGMVTLTAAVRPSRDPPEKKTGGTVPAACQYHRMPGKGKEVPLRETPIPVNPSECQMNPYLRPHSDPLR
jgi:hypothetical protein